MLRDRLWCPVRNWLLSNKLYSIDTSLFNKGNFNETVELSMKHKNGTWYSNSHGRVNSFLTRVCQIGKDEWALEWQRICSKNAKCNTVWSRDKEALHYS